MTFASIVFLVFFLPATFGLFLLLVRLGTATRVIVVFVSLASLVFYAWAGLTFLLIFLVSISVNFALAELISNAAKARRPLLYLGIGLNLSLLGYFKYKVFVLDMLGAGGVAALSRVALPVGISFYTFQKIAYLVDIASGQARPKPLLHYLLFVSFFPQLVAGPIVRHHDFFPQIPGFIAQVRRPRYVGVYLTSGLMLLIIGLAKKVLLADSFAMLADPAFELAAQEPLSALPGWIGILSYSFQIYFDFSGYSDMAIGLALLFGIRLPVNFNSPYQATSVIDFWRRWHITLSTFLRDYLYIPLGGNRFGTSRRYVNLMLTMLLGGLWHGASWNFVLWGGLHALLLSLNHGLRNLIAVAVPRPLAISVVFLVVTLCWVPFRAADFTTTLSYYRSLAGGEGLLLPSGFGGLASMLGIQTSANLPSFSGFRGMLAVGMGFLIVWFSPNSLVVLTSGWRRRLARSRIVAIGFAGVFVLSLGLVYARQSTPFIYFQF